MADGHTPRTGKLRKQFWAHVYSEWTRVCRERSEPSAERSRSLCVFPRTSAPEILDEITSLHFHFYFLTIIFITNVVYKTLVFLRFYMPSWQGMVQPESEEIRACGAKLRNFRVRRIVSSSSKHKKNKKTPWKPEQKKYKNWNVDKILRPDPGNLIEGRPPYIFY